MERLRSLREHRNLYQKDVAEALEIDRTTYAKYESGTSEPSFEILKKLAKFFEVTTDYLLEYDLVPSKKTKKQPLPLSLEEEQLVMDFREFNDKGREKILEEVYMMRVSGIYKNCDDLPGLA